MKEASADADLGKAAQLLSLYYEGDEQPTEAERVLKDASERIADSPDLKSSYIMKELLYQWAKLAVQHEQPEQLEQLTSKLVQSNIRPKDLDLDSRLVWLKAQMLLRQGSVSRALTALDADGFTSDENLQPAGELGKPERAYQVESIRSIRNQLQKASDQGIQELTDVSGTITRADGSPLAYAGVFLRRQSDVYSSIRDDEPYQTMTNAKGQYIFRGVLPGAYQINIGLDLEQISGWTWPGPYDDWIDVRQQSITRNIVFQRLLELKSPVNNAVVKDKEITFEWEPVKGAASYDVSLGVEFESGSGGSVFKQDIHGEKLQVSAEELYHISGGILSSSQGNEELEIEPNSLLEYSNPEAQLNWSVQAYDAAGRMITRSNGYRLGHSLTGKLPLFYLKERTLSKADQTLLAGDLENALLQYKEEYGRNPEDLHSLHMIIRVLEGQHSMLDANQKDSKQGEGLEKEMVEYLKQMVKKHPSSAYYDKITNYYYNQQDWKEYNEYYALWEKSNVMRDIHYTAGIHGIALMKQGSLKEAEASLKRSLKQDGSHRFIGAYVALDLYIRGSMDHAIQLSMEYPDHIGSNLSLDWTEILMVMKKESAGSDSYMKLLQESIELYMQNRSQEIKTKLHDGSGHAAMIAFLDALEDVR